MNLEQLRKVNDIASRLGWNLIPIHNYEGPTFVFQAWNTKYHQLPLFLAVQPDGSHKFYKNLTDVRMRRPL